MTAYPFGLCYPNLKDVLARVNHSVCHQQLDIDLTKFNIPLVVTN